MKCHLKRRKKLFFFLFGLKYTKYSTDYVINCCCCMSIKNWNGYMRPLCILRPEYVAIKSFNFVINGLIFYVSFGILFLFFFASFEQLNFLFRPLNGIFSVLVETCLLFYVFFLFWNWTLLRTSILFSIWFFFSLFTFMVL